MASYQHHKRKHIQHDMFEEEVDDLAIAASYAIMTAPGVPTASPTIDNHQSSKEPLKQVTTNDAGSDSDSDDSNCSRGSFNRTPPIKNDTIANKNGSAEDDESDDESDIDLSEQLAKMKDDGADEFVNDKKNVKSRPTRIAVPTTQNEVDLYNTDVADLEKRLNYNLDLEDQAFDNAIFEVISHSGILNAKISRDRIRLAGHVKFHMLHERTIVVESNPDGVDRFHHARHDNSMRDSKPFLLSEGTGLYLMLEVDSVFKKIIGDVDGRTTPLADNEVSIVPLGKILEVFGPVKKPLYTVRLKGLSKFRIPHSSDETQVKKEDCSVSTGRASNEMTKEENKMMDVVASQSSEENKTQEVDSEAINTPEIDQGKQQMARQKMEISQPMTRVDDPWSVNGVLTQWIKSSETGLEVYCSTSQVKEIDTQAVRYASGKGCDASNIYDEEILDVKDMYFSDDEEERNTKRRNKKKSQPDQKVRSDNRNRNPSNGRGRGKASRHNHFSNQFPQNMCHQQVGPMASQYNQQRPFVCYPQAPVHQGFIPHTTSPQQSVFSQAPPPPPPPPANSSGVYYPAVSQSGHPIQTQPYYSTSAAPPTQTQSHPYHNTSTVPQPMLAQNYPQQYQHIHPQQCNQLSQTQYPQSQQYGKGDNDKNDTVYYNFSG